jgi:hypothetical protein
VLLRRSKIQIGRVRISRRFVTKDYHNALHFCFLGGCCCRGGSNVRFIADGSYGCRLANNAPLAVVGFGHGRSCLWRLRRSCWTFSETIADVDPADWGGELSSHSI